MDHITETKILDTISQLKKLGKGVLIITHKESTAGIADCIYEMVSANNEIPALPT